MLIAVSRKKFQGDKASRARIFRLVNDSHPAAEFLDDAVMRDDLLDNQC